MFNYVHHVNHLVYDLPSVEAFFKKHFGLEPIAREEGVAPLPNTMSYQVGPTILRFVEPTHQHSKEFADLWKAGGPVISHIGLAVENIDKKAKELKEAGVDFTQPEPIVSPHGGYKVIDIAPEGSYGAKIRSGMWKLNKILPENHFGIRFQLCENIK